MNLSRVNERVFSEIIAKKEVSELAIKVDGDKKTYSYYTEDELLGQKTQQGERVRYYLQEVIVKSLPKESQKRHAHKGQRKAAKEQQS